MITMEMIDEFRKRTNCSYQEAKLYLERNNGSFVDAIVDFEKTHNKIKDEKKASRGDFFNKALNTKFIIEHNYSTILNISVLFLGILILLTLPALPVFLISLLVALILGCKISIKKYTGTQVQINELITNAGKNNSQNNNQNQ